MRLSSDSNQPRHPGHAAICGLAMLALGWAGCGASQPPPSAATAASSPSPHAEAAGSGAAAPTRMTTPPPAAFTIYGVAAAASVPGTAQIELADLPRTVRARLLPTDDPIELTVRTLTAGQPPVVVTARASMSPEERLAWPVVALRARHAMTLVLGADDIEFQLEVKLGKLSLPARDHGVLLAALALAAATGRPPTPSATVLGTLGDDGIVGPSSLPPEGKRPWSSEARASQLGLPRGETATAPGVKLVTIDDVPDAFAVLTGKRLARPALATDAEVALDAQERATLRSRYLSERATNADLLGAPSIEARRTQQPTAAARLAGEAQVLVQRAETAFAADHLAAAAAHLEDAIVYATAYRCTRDRLAAGLRRDGAALSAMNDAMTNALSGAGTTSQAAVASRIHGLAVDSVGDALRAISALEAVQIAAGHLQQGRAAQADAALALTLLATQPGRGSVASAEAGDAADKSRRLCLASARSSTAVARAHHRLEWEAASSARLGNAAEHLRTRTDLLTVQSALEWAEAAVDGRPALTASAEEIDATLRAARLAAPPAHHGTDAGPPSEGSPPAPTTDFFDVLEHFAALHRISADRWRGELAASLDDAALAAVVARAERQARRMARFARGAAGAVPVQTRLALATAADRPRDDRDELLRALRDYQRAIAFAGLAVSLAAAR